MSAVTDDRAPAYGLGHSESELNRLKDQARIIAPITRQILRDAGLVPGMRVLDTGCGVGDVSLLVAELIGEAGEIVGIDRSDVALDMARARAAAEGRKNISFLRGDATKMSFALPFDAVVGRYVLGFQPDPSATLRNLATHLPPGGIMAFHEHDWQGVQSFPPAPLYDSCYSWNAQTLERYGTNMRIGIGLYSAFVAAGLPEPSMTLQAVIGGGRKAVDCMHLAVDPIHTLAPETIRLGIATEEEIGLATLFDRLRDEVVTNGSVLVGRSEIGAWARR